MRRQRLFRIFPFPGILLILILLPAVLPALEITSVAPGRVSPGDSVTVSGGPFTRGTRILLGNQTIEPSALAERTLTFTVPSLEDGEYVLRARDEEETSPQSFLLRVAAANPRIESLSPPSMDVCAQAGGRDVTIQGRNFEPGATVLLEGKTIGSSRSDSETIVFTPPPLASGVYGVQVVNPNGGSSIPHSLYMSDLPEILNVYMGEEFINYYQLVIEGKNFFFNSTLLVNEYSVVFDRPPEQRVIRHQSATTDPDKQAAPTQSDNVVFVDCGTLIYNRYPYSTQPKTVSLQIINPDGKTSSTWDLSVP